MATMLHLHPSPSPSPSSLSSSSSRFLQSSLRTLSHSNQRTGNLTSSNSICKASWQELTGVLIVSAIPFTAVKAIANSPLGESLRRRMKERKKSVLEDSVKFNALVKT